MAAVVFDESFLGYGKYKFDEFKFENGDVLEDVNVEYNIIGTPKYDDDGNIVNAVVYCHNFNGSCSSINNLYQITADGAPFDKNEYCLISISALGFPESCSPSTTGLKYKFPKYTVLDVVNFNRQFLHEFLNINHVLGVCGVGLGGYSVYTWACEYPDEMEFIMVCDSSYKTNGYRYVITRAVDSIIESSDGFYDDAYDYSLSKTMVSIYKLLYSFYFSKKVFQEMSNDQIDVLMDDYVDEGLFTDIYDVKFANDIILNFNIEEKLGDIKARALIFGNEDDLYYSSEDDTLPLKNLIENCKVVLYKSRRDHTGYEDYSVMFDEFWGFLRDFKK